MYATEQVYHTSKPQARNIFFPTADLVKDRSSKLFTMHHHIIITLHRIRCLYSQKTDVDYSRAHSETLLLSNYELNISVA